VYFIAIFTPLLRSIACKADILFSKALPEWMCVCVCVYVLCAWERESCSFESVTVESIGNEIIYYFWTRTNLVFLRRVRSCADIYFHRPHGLATCHCTNTRSVCGNSTYSQRCTLITDTHTDTHTHTHKTKDLHQWCRWRNILMCWPCLGDQHFDHAQQVVSAVGCRYRYWLINEIIDIRMSQALCSICPVHWTTLLRSKSSKLEFFFLPSVIVFSGSCRPLV
jgi:hypothetical protein